MATWYESRLASNQVEDVGPLMIKGSEEGEIGH